MRHSAEYNTFSRAVERIMSVPKAEILRREEEYRKEAALNPNKCGPAEKFVIKWQFRFLGDFETALIECIKCADERNLERLAEGFPTQVDGFRQWAYGSLGTRLRNAGLEI